MSSITKQEIKYCKYCEESVAFEACFEKEDKTASTILNIFIIWFCGAVFVLCLMFLYYQFGINTGSGILENGRSIVDFYLLSIEQREFPVLNVVAILVVIGYISSIFGLFSAGKETQTTYWTCRTCGNQV